MRANDTEVNDNLNTLSQVPLLKLLDLKIVFAFKQLFGSERNKQLTIALLNAILQRTGRVPINEVTFITQEVSGEYIEDKQCRLDIVVKTQYREFINIEIQLANKKDMFKRTLFYWSRLYNLQLQKGKGYHTLNPTITINICDFTFFPNAAHYHSTYHLYDDISLQRIQDNVLEIHFIEMDKFLKAWAKEQHPSNKLDRWLLLLGMVDDSKKIVRQDIYNALEDIAMTDENIRKAFQAWQEISQDPETILAYQSRVKYMLDEAANIEDAKYHAEQEGMEKGIEKGMKKGMKQGIEGIARKMIRKGNSNEEIIELTNLSLEEVQSLRQEI